MYDDIPEAFRQPSSESPTPRPQPLLWVGSGIGVVAVVWGGWFALSAFNPTPSESASESAPAAVPSAEPQSPDTILGHFKYAEASPVNLKAISADGRLKLQTSAAESYQRMAAAARTAGVSLQPLSAFRTIKEQEFLFFKVKEQRAQDTAKRADVSAPPQHSEHHTGYAIDVGDGSQPKTNLSESFDQTRTFKWLEANAPRFSFELSFPKGNAQGVSYEPWHWRYVGDQASLETFYSARQLKPTQEFP
ncbi:MAG: M15 family metallopeptidase [Thermosynechococcaceae cyanobacterium]